MLEDRHIDRGDLTPRRRHGRRCCHSVEQVKHTSKYELSRCCEQQGGTSTSSDSERCIFDDDAKRAQSVPQRRPALNPRPHRVGRPRHIPPTSTLFESPRAQVLVVLLCLCRAAAAAVLAEDVG